MMMMLLPFCALSFAAPTAWNVEVGQWWATERRAPQRPVQCRRGAVRALSGSLAFASISGSVGPAWQGDQTSTLTLCNGGRFFTLVLHLRVLLDSSKRLNVSVLSTGSLLWRGILMVVGSVMEKGKKRGPNAVWAKWRWYITRVLLEF